MPKKIKKPKKTLRFYCVVKGCPKDFGMGVGVLGRAEVTFTDEYGRGFDNPIFQMHVMEQAEEFMKQHVTVLTEEKKPGMKWDCNPMATYKKERR